MQSVPLDLGHVPQGPRAYRARMRRLGPVVGLVPPGVLGAIAWVLLRDNTSTVRGVGSFLLAVLAAPGLLVMGVPLSSGGQVYVVGIGASVLLWLLVGVVASRRATRVPAANWRDFWREYVWLAAGVWVGVVAALVAANLIVGRALI
jgi:hypothetical protein